MLGISFFLTICLFDESIVFRLHLLSLISYHLHFFDFAGLAFQHCFMPRVSELALIYLYFLMAIGIAMVVYLSLIK